jgi:hypothetical protein
MYDDDEKRMHRNFEVDLIALADKFLRLGMDPAKMSEIMATESSDKLWDRREELLQ